MMDMHEACSISMWNAVHDSRKEKALSQLKLLSQIMSPGFSGVLFRNTLDYIFHHAFLPDNKNIRYRVRHFHSILPRTESADVLIRENSFNNERKNLKIEHITSIRTLGNYFEKNEFCSVLKNFNVCIVTNSENDVLGRGCGAGRYKSADIKLIVPLNSMIKTV